MKNEKEVFWKKCDEGVVSSQFLFSLLLFAHEVKIHVSMDFKTKPVVLQKCKKK